MAKKKRECIALFCSLHFCSVECKYSNISFQIHQGSLITPSLFLFLQNQNVLLTVPAFLLGWAGERESACFPLWKMIRQTARELGAWKLARFAAKCLVGWEIWFLLKGLEVLVYFSCEKRPHETLRPCKAWKHLILNHPHSDLLEILPGSQGVQVHYYL